MPAVAVTDVNNLFGVFEITETLAKAGVQPIVGCLLAVELGIQSAGHGSRAKPPLLPLLVQNEAGYRNLTKLLERGLSLGRTGRLAACDGGEAGRSFRRADRAHRRAGRPAQPPDRGWPARGRRGAARPAGRASSRAGFMSNCSAMAWPRSAPPRTGCSTSPMPKALPLVATNDVHFGPADMYEAHDALLCIADGAFVSQDDRRRLTREHRFKSAAEMTAQFADLPEAIENTIEIARRCAFRPKRHDPILPEFVPESGRTPEEEIRVQAEEGLARAWPAHGRHADEEVYRERLEYELGVIIKMEFAGYFLIVSDFMKWTRGQGIPVGVRGSGASSLVAWALDITNLDPLRFGLLFERFLNPERISMPDFDIDFCQERRDEVVRYVRDKYGHDKVAHIIALGSLQARAAVRDVGRVLQMPLGLVDRIAKLIPNPPGKHVELQDAIDSEPRLQQIAEQEPMAERLFSIIEKIEGLYRHASTHPAGVVIGDRPLDELLPLYRDPRSEMPVTQFDYEDAEKAGLVKFDFLGLKTLTVIAKAEELLKRRGIELDTQNIDFDDRRHLRDAGAGRQRRRLPARRRGHARPDAQDEARPYQRSGGAGGALSPRPDGFDPEIHRLQERQGGAGISASRCWSRSCKRNLRRDDLSGRRHAHRARAGRLHHGPGRHSAPRHGQEDRLRDGQAARKVHQGRGASAASCPPSPSRFSSRRRNSRATASTRAMPRPMPRSPIRRPISRRIIRSNSSPPR